MDIKEVTYDFTVKISKKGMYITWLSYHWGGNFKARAYSWGGTHVEGKEEVVPIYGEDLDNIQGILTVPNAFNIPPSDIILYKIYKDCIFYDINGLNLPTPQ